MSRRLRTGFAWAAAPDQPFIDIRWDYRRGRVLNPVRAAAWLGRARLAAWALILACLVQALVEGRAP